MGRKAISGERKTSYLTLRLTIGERAAMDAKATAVEKSTSAWARDLLLADAAVMPPPKSIANSKPPKSPSPLPPAPAAPKARTRKPKG
jgi:hypothetical protein